jgi:type III pantothenate kinase
MVVDSQINPASRSESPSHWLAVDVGNSRVKFGVFQSPADEGSLPACSQFLTSDPQKQFDWKQLQETLRHRPFRSVLVGSNQKGVDAVLAAWPEELQPKSQTVFRDSTEFSIEIDVDAPRGVGLDRLLAAIAANRLRKAGETAIVVDCGTATTVDVVSSEGVFLGGAILPGFELSARALNHYTEVLPYVSIDELIATDAQGQHAPLGKNTHAAISSGIFWGQVGAVRELIARQAAVCSPTTSPQVFVTGGGGELLAPFLDQSSHYPYLALQGLVIAAQQQPGLTVAADA